MRLTQQSGVAAMPSGAEPSHERADEKAQGNGGDDHKIKRGVKRGGQWEKCERYHGTVRDREHYH